MGNHMQLAVRLCQVSGLVPHLHQADPDDVQRLIAAAAAGFLGCFVGGIVF